MERRLLTPDELSEALAAIPAWSVDGGRLRRRFEFADFASALSFVVRAGEAADAMDHHPDITLGWGYAEFAVTTHDRGGITHLDIELARRIDRL